jgi:hypothetical protein
MSKCVSKNWKYLIKDILLLIFDSDHESGGENAFYKLTAEMILESGNYEFFFGKLTSEWVRTRGAVDMFKQQTTVIIAKVADELQMKGDVSNAVSLLLYSEVSYSTNFSFLS